MKAKQFIIDCHLSILTISLFIRAFLESCLAKVDSNFITSVTKDLILLISGISGRLGKAGILGNLGRLGTLHPFLKYLINPRNIMKFTFDFLNDSKWQTYSSKLFHHHEYHRLDKIQLGQDWFVGQKSLFDKEQICRISKVLKN